MKLHAQAQIKLSTLVTKGSLPASHCGQAFLKLLGPLLDSGVVSWQRSGVGRRLVVNDADTLRSFSRQGFPNSTLPGNVSSRIVGVGRFRDTKAVPNREHEIISVRVWRNDALLKNGEPFGAAAATSAHGVFSFRFAPNCPYALRGSCAVIENPAVFAAVERLNLGVDAAIYGSGRISNRALDWLVRTDSNLNLLHLPDYDPVGLAEFQRLHARLGKRVTLYLPTDIEARFSRFSNSKLLLRANSQTMLARLRRSEVSTVRRVIELLDRYNGGLEQEALLVQF